MSNEAHRRIAESILGHIEWQDGDIGFCTCPGEKLHTSPTKIGHCRVNLDGVPTIYCFHSSCLGDVEHTNHLLRSAIAKHDYKPDPNLNLPPIAERPLTPEEIAKLKHKKAQEKIRALSSKNLDSILRQFEIGLADFWELSPCRLLDDPDRDWRLMLELFEPSDVVWIGDKFSSCGDDKPDADKARCRRFFRTVREWLAEETQCPGNFTCPSTFKPGTYSRSNENVIERRFLVIESDILEKDQMAAVINWTRQFLYLRAIVDTAGKSIHGWFNAPSMDWQNELRVALPNLGRTDLKAPYTLDPALFKLSQPCRMPGALRDAKHQSLLYLDLNWPPPQ